MLAITTINSRWGRISIVAADHAVIRVILPGGEHPVPATGSMSARRLVFSARDMVLRYLDGERISLSLPTIMPATPFFRAVYEQLRHIPYGQTITYRELARLAGSPLACRAAGQAVARNPVPIIVPCHRVVAAEGMGGFGGGLELKRALLELEGVRGVGSARGDP